MISSQIFPGIYTTVTDRSFTTQISSRFHAGLIGVAEKGPFNTPTLIQSSRDFQRIFGRSIDSRYMAVTAGLLANLSDGTTVIRVGNQYKAVATDGSGAAGSYTVRTAKAALFTTGEYVRVKQAGKATTVAARINAIPGSHDRLTLVSTGSEAVALADTYTGAEVDHSDTNDAANEAEAFLYKYTYGSAKTLVGDVVGTKNAYEFTVNGDPTLLSAGDLIKITQTGRATSRELMIKEVQAKVGGVAKIILYPSNRTEVGYQAVPLQDSYTTGTIYVVTTSSGVPVVTLSMPLKAASAGAWANSNGTTTGLIVVVQPGSKVDTKRFNVYDNSALVESIDNLSTDADSTDYYVTRINGKSGYIAIPDGLDVTDHPANTVNPWNTSVATELNLAAFLGGVNGATPNADEFVGTVIPETDVTTGLKAFDDTSILVDVLYAPDVSVLFDDSAIVVHQELNRMARLLNAIGIVDVPKGLNGRAAVDWHNGEGIYSNHPRLDTYSLATFWNWFTVVDPYTGLQRMVPPGIAYLLCAARTYDQAKPWRAAAGETWGLISDALAVQYPKVTADTRAGMYGTGTGNSVNPILVTRAGTITVFGERTMQRLESKLSVIHSVVLTNFIVRGLADIGRRFVFEPNDDTLLSQIRSAYGAFLDSIVKERGLEEYKLVVDTSNNNAATRNAREVIVDLSFIPTDAVERIFINAVVRASGADLVSAT